MKTPPVTDGGSDLDRLRSAVADTKRVFNDLEDLICHPATRGVDVIRRTAITGSSPSWHSQAAYLVFELGAISRELEAGLRRRTTGSESIRGFSDANTFLALDAVVALTLSTSDAVDSLNILCRWVRRGREALGEVEPLSRLPRVPGQPELRCPYCTFLTLRYQQHAGLVRCVNPNCLDDDERRPLAYVELGRLSHEPILAWRDGSSGLGAAQ